MAEVLGVVASGIAVAQVATTLGSAVVRLKALWEEVREVPERIADLMEQIDCLDPALWEAERLLSENELPAELWTDISARRSAEYCRKALRKLTALIDDLSAKIHSPKSPTRKIGRFRAVLKKDTLNILESRLESAVRLLQLAQQGYIITLVKHQPGVIANTVIQKLETAQQLRVSETPPADRRVSESNVSDQHSSSRKRSTVLKPRFKRPWSDSMIHSSFGLISLQSADGNLSADIYPPWWLRGIMYARSIHVQHSYSGWKIRLRSYSIRLFEETRAFSAAMLGDVSALQKLFGSGEASPYDRSETGRTLLHYAAGSGQPEVLRYFIQSGVDIDANEADQYGKTIAQQIGAWAFHAGRYDSSDKIWENVQEFANLVSHHDIIPDTTRNAGERLCCCPETIHLDVLHRMQLILCPAHSKTTLQSRLWSCRGRYASRERAKFMLDPEWSTDPSMVCKISCDTSLIHTIAGDIGDFGFKPSTISYPQNAKAIEAFFDFAQEVVSNTRRLHILERSYFDRQRRFLTPLIRLVLWPIFLFDSGKTRYQLEIASRLSLSLWLGVLKTSGINLYAYGAVENRIMRDPEANILRYQMVEFQSKRSDWKSCVEFAYELIGFKYGKQIEDWDILWNEPTDAFAGDFWALVEDFSPYIPGEWPDEEMSSVAL